MLEKHPFDIGAYEKRAKEGPCFICELVAEGNPHDVIYEVVNALRSGSVPLLVNVELIVMHQNDWLLC
jgi:hypothetical protein